MCGLLTARPTIVNAARGHQHARRSQRVLHTRCVSLGQHEPLSTTATAAAALEHIGSMEAEQRSTVAGATAAPSSQNPACKRRCASGAATMSSRSYAHATPAHSILLLLILVYLVAHIGMVLHQTHQLLLVLHGGQLLTRGGLLRLVLVCHELLTVTCGYHQMRSVRYSSSCTEVADRSLLQFGFIVPVFQCLFVAVNAAGWQRGRTWWGLQASMALLGVLCRFRPSHSLLHALSSGTLMTLLQCCSDCYAQRQTCTLMASSFLRCIAVHGSVIQLAGFIAWAASYTAVRKSALHQAAASQLHSAPAAMQGAVASLERTSSGAKDGGERSDRGREGGPPLSSKPTRAPSPPAAASPKANDKAVIDHSHESVSAGVTQASGSQVAKAHASTDKREVRGQSGQAAGAVGLSRLRPRRQACAEGSGLHAVGRAGDAVAGGGEQQAQGQHQHQQESAEGQQDQDQQQDQEQQQQQQEDQQQSQSRQHTDADAASPVPLEFLGIYIFRVLGLASLLQRLDVIVTAFVDNIDERLVVRLVCMPVAIHCLLHAVLARLRFLNFDLGCLSYDLLFIWMAAIFMLGRDSVTFDLHKGLSHVQDQIAATLRALSKPRPQTVTELVDSVRQQIAGGDCSPLAGQSVDDCVTGKNIKLREVLGEGTFGKVYKGIWRGTVVAVKSMVLPRNAGLRKERMAIMEAAISSALSHPNILQTYTYSLQPVRGALDVGTECTALPVDLVTDQAAEDLGGSDSQGSATVACGFEVRLVTEFMDLGTLRDALDRDVFTHPPTMDLDFSAVLDTAIDIAKGVLHLHSLNIIHGDLKARNVLLQSCASEPRGFLAKIGDFGLSHKMEAEETHISKLFQGTPTHMAPEVFLLGHQSKGADAYSFGVTMWELYTGQHPFPQVPAAMLAHHVADLGERPCFPLDAPDSYAQLAQRCWAGDVRARPCFTEILAVLVHMRKTAGSSRPFPCIAERLQAATQGEQPSFGRELPSAIILGDAGSKGSTWGQL